MSTALKRLALFFFSVILLIVIIVGGLTVWLLTTDANRLKPLLEKAYNQHGITVQFDGDLAWALYPMAGIKTEQIKFYASQHVDKRQPLASAGMLGLEIDLLQFLLTEKLEISSVQVHEPRIYLLVDKNGISNWRDVTSPNARPREPETASSGDGRSSDKQGTRFGENFRINTVDVSDLLLQYENEQTQTSLLLSESKLTINNVNLNGEAMRLAMESAVSINDHPQLRIQHQSEIVLSKNQHLRIKPFLLSLVSEGKNTLALEGDFELDLKSRNLHKAHLQLAETHPGRWLKALQVPLTEMQGPATFTSLSADTSFSFIDNNLQIHSLAVKFDESRINANAQLQLRPALPPSVSANIHFDTINVDNYLAPKQAGNPPQSNSNTPAAAQADQPLDFSLLENQHTSINVRADTVKVHEQTLRDVTMQLSLHNNAARAQLQQLQHGDGQLLGEARLTWRAPEAELDLTLQGEKINVGEILRSTRLYEQLDGSASFTLSAHTQGSSRRQWLDMATANLSARAAHMQLGQINLEQSYCDAIANLERKTAKQDWPNYTELKNLQTQLHYAENTLQIDQAQGQMQGITAWARGSVSAADLTFTIPLDIALADFTAAQKNCPLLNNKWRKQKIPLICKGKVESLGRKTCTLDYTRLSDKLEQNFKREADKLESNARGRAKELSEDVKQESDKVENKAEERFREAREESKDKVDEKSRELLEDLVGEEKSDELEEKFKKLLNR